MIFPLPHDNGELMGSTSIEKDYAEPQHLSFAASIVSDTWMGMLIYIDTNN